MAESITIRGVTKSYDGKVEAVSAVDLDVAEGELLVLVGPSGCGKSTLLRMVAGLEEVTAGSVAIGDRDVTWLPPKDRDIAMVFQSYALYPHMSVRKNIAYPLRLAKVPKAQAAQRVDEVADMLQLTEVLDRRPSQLSGGQRQRVAMGRALVREPRAFLMDEPLSNLDAKLRVEMRAEIARLQRDLGVTTLYVTHDQVEAMTMGTRVAVLDKGTLQQVDTPQRIYDAPRNLFVATFVGSPAMNLLDATVVDDDGGRLALDLGGQRLSVDDILAASHPSLAERKGRRVVVGIRPEALTDAALEPDAPGDRVLDATVDLVESLGAELVVYAAVPGATVLRGRADGTLVAAQGSAIWQAHHGSAARPHGDTARGLGSCDLSVEPPSKGRVVDSAADAEALAAGNGAIVSPAVTARLSTKSRVGVGDSIKLVVDPGGLHVFDPDSGASLRQTADTDSDSDAEAGQGA